VLGVLCVLKIWKSLREGKEKTERKIPDLEKFELL